jgi:hypothetical protein
LATTEPAATTEFSPIVTPPMMVALAAIHKLFSITIGFPKSGCASLRRFNGMARRDDAHVRPNHHIVRDVEAAKVIETTINRLTNEMTLVLLANG